MERFFLYRDRWGHGLAMWVVVAVCCSLPPIFFGVSRARLENDVTTWLPRDDPDAVLLDWFSREFDHDSSLLFSWDSSSLDDPRVERFRDAVLNGTGEIPPVPGVLSVTGPREVLARMSENQIPQPAAVERLTGVLVGRGFLKVELTVSGRAERQDSLERIRAAAEDRLGRPVQWLPPVNSTDDGEREPLVSFDPHDFQLRWSEIASTSPETLDAIDVLRKLETAGSPLVARAFFQSGAPVALSIALNDYGEEEIRPTLDAIRATALAIGLPEGELRMGGTPVSRGRLNREALHAVWNRAYPAWNLFRRSPILLSVLVGIAAAFLLLRSLKLALLVVGVSVYVCLAVVALIPATGKSLNVVLVVLPPLLLVLTMSGAIHLANYWRFACARGENHPIARAVGAAWLPCFLASVTTAIGMASLVTAVLSPVREFGIYSSIGCLLSLAVILFVFPSLLAFWPRPAGMSAVDSGGEQRFWAGAARWLLKHRVAVNVANLVLLAACLYGLQWFRTETKVIRYFPADSRIVQDYNFLEEGLAGIVSIETVVRFDQTALAAGTILERLETVREVQRRISAHPWVSGAVSLADFRPETAPPPDSATTRVKVLYRQRARRTEQEIFENQSTATVSFAKRADAPVQVVRHRIPVEVAAGDEIWRIRAQASVMGDVDYGPLTEELTLMVQESLQSSPGAHGFVTGMVPLFLRTQQAVLESLIESFALAFVIIAVVMMVLLRSVVSGGLAMIPNLMPVGVVFGLVAWAGIPVDIGTMITASVALGIAIDGTLHLLTWFRDGLREGLTRDEAVVQALAQCGPAMWQTSATVAAGIVMLAGAELLLISRFGWLMAALVVMALIGDLVVLPAMLGGWLGAVIERTERRRGKMVSNATRDGDADSHGDPVVTASTP